MLGVILCGGNSSRMGADKGLLKQEAKTWAQTAADTMCSLEIPVKISVNDLQFDSYATLFSSGDLIIDNKELEIGGPLKGLLSVHVEFPEQDIFLLACDMPLMSALVLRDLIDSYNKIPDKDVFVFSNGGQAEPLCAIYKATGLHKILSLYKSNKLVKHSMEFMLEQLQTFFLPIPENYLPYFRNFNAHAELNGL